ncbi:unnamed protein product, partial [Didymodactylos carnosus]
SAAISYQWIKDIFNKQFRHSISSALEDSKRISQQQIKLLAWKIEHLYPTYHNNYTSYNLTKYIMEDYVDIIHKLISVKNEQWISIKQCLESFWKLLCLMSEDYVSTEVVFKQACLFQFDYLKNESWHKIQAKYTALTKQLTWQELIDFIDIIGSSTNSIVELKKEHIQKFIDIVQSLQQETTILKVWDCLLKLCPFLLTNDKCTELDNKQICIQTILSTLTPNISTNDLLNEFKSCVSSTLQNQIEAYNHLIQSHSALIDPTVLTDEQQFKLLNNLIPSWLTLSKISNVQQV